MFFAQTAFMLLGGSALVGRDQARPLFFVLLSAYELVYVIRLGQTPGKDLLDIRVTGPDGAPPSPARAGLRWLPLLAVAAIPDPRASFVLLLAVTAPAALGRARRGTHDLLAGTVVVAYDADHEEGLEPVDLDPLDRLRRDRRFR